MAAEEVRVPPCCGVPSLVLHKGAIRPQVHAHGPAAPGTAGHQLRRHRHFGRHAVRECQRPVRRDDVALGGHHGADGLGIIVGGVVAGLAALPQPVVPLGIEEAALVEAGLLEAVVHVGGQHEPVLPPDQGEEAGVHGLGRVQVPVDIDVAAPIGPALLRCGEGIKAAAVHILKAVPGGKVPEIALEPLPGVDEAGGGGKARTGADEHGVRLVQGPAKAGDGLTGGGGGFGKEHGDHLMYKLYPAYHGRAPLAIRYFSVLIPLPTGAAGAVFAKMHKKYYLSRRKVYRRRAAGPLTGPGNPV